MQVSQPPAQAASSGWGFESASGSALSTTDTKVFPHGLDQRPSEVQAFLKKTTSAQDGFSIGDEVPIFSHATDNVTGFLVYSDATNVYVVTPSSGVGMPRPSDNAMTTYPFSVTWDVIVRARI